MITLRSNNRSSSITQYNSKANMMSSNDIFSIFCATSSIRGMQKINKAQTPFLKVLWVGFVFITTFLLLVTIVLLVKEYLGYYTAWHTSTKLEDESVFPAITMCSHNPFSMEAKNLWREKKIKTPSQFTDRLINLSLVYLHENERSGFDTMVLRDEVQYYYTSLAVNETINLSHLQEFFQFCVVDVVDQKLVSTNCTADMSDYLSVRKFSHRNYFNCWTVEPQKMKTGDFYDISSLIIVASLIPSNLIPELKDAFVMDILERGEGLKIVLHETGTYPDIDKKGFNIQPGKLNEIAYEPIKWTFLSTPVKMCKDDQKEIKDLDRIFNYTFSQCVDTALQESMLKECNCLSSLWPRHITPNEQYPYCFNIWRGSASEIMDKYDCAFKFMLTMKSRKQAIQMNQCFPRCNFFTYSTTLSITKWLPSIKKLDRISKVQNHLEMLFKNRADTVTQDNYRTYITTKYLDNKKSRNNDSLDEDKFTYIKLIRKNKNTTIKTEKLVLDVAILLSRIGGLCSLFIGLTVAFFIELIEFVYLLIQMKESQTLSVDTNTNVNRKIKSLTNQNDSKQHNNETLQSLNFTNENAENYIDNSLQSPDMDERLEENSDNDILVWHHGEANDMVFGKKGEKSYPRTIVSEL